MHAVGKTKKKLVDEINITPLTDVFLVLLIIMMVVAPIMKSTRAEIKLPKVDGGSPIDKAKTMIEVTQDGTYFVDGQQTPLENLVQVLRDKNTTTGDTEFIIQADRYTKSRAVMKIFDAAREAQYKQMTISVESLTPDRAKALEAQAQPPAASSETTVAPDTATPPDTAPQEPRAAKEELPSQS